MAAVAAVTGNDLGAAFHDFCLSQRAELLDLIATRSTQTNEVGRCAALLPALGAIEAQYGQGQPLSLLDLGTSAGLNLLFDRVRLHAYRQQSATGSSWLAGDPDRRRCVLIDCHRCAVTALTSCPTALPDP